MDQDETWHAGRPRPQTHSVRPAPAPPKRHSPPIFRPCLLWPNRWMDQDGTWHGGGLSPGHIMLDGDSAPHLKKGGRGPQSSAYRVQTAVYIRIPLSTEVGISLGDIVLDGDPDLPPLKRHSPQFLANVRYG